MKHELKSIAVRIAVCWLCFGPAAAANAADAFVFGFEDLPLMNALTQVPGASVLFDTPQGRIVQASATGQVDRAAVVAFYRDTLPQMGWTHTDETEFQREGETLRLEFSRNNSTLEVRFLIEPTATR